MSKLKVYIVASVMLLVTACASQKKIQDDEFATDPTFSESSTADGGGISNDDLSLDEPAASSVASNGSADEFSDFDQNAGSSTSAVNDGDSALENELNSLDSSGNPAQSPQQQQAQAAPTPPEAPAVEPQPVPQPEVIAEQPVPTPIVEETPVAVAPEPTPVETLSQINSIDYKSNDSGGTILIGADQPLQFSTRVNSTTNQLVVEVQNSVIPKKLKRSLNTKDMASSIGSVDIYQKPNSKISRFVIQLRPGSPEPLVQPEGNSLLIIGGANPHYVSTKQSQAPQQQQTAIEMNGSANTASNEVNPDLTSEGIMSTQTLEDFLMSNNHFYGKKISIETNNLDVKDAIKFIAEESGVNMIMDDGLDGKVSLKLRQVPWDQALVLLLKSKKLGYKRQGNVLRIAKIDDIQKEEADGIRMKEAKLNAEPLMVKRFFIGYADIKELETKIRDFLYSTGVVAPGAGAAATAANDASAANGRAKVISDARTSSLIVTDTPSNMIKIEKLIAALDTQPQQVLIEGKVIEATEGFTRQVGVQWRNDSTTATTVNRGGVTITPTLGTNLSILSSSLTWGQLDVLGNLTAQLSLGEQEQKVRVLSSPRVTVLSSQTATISQTTGVLIPKTEVVTPASAGGTSSVTLTNEIVPVGVMLKVIPQVSNEGTVTLDMDIERSFLAQTDSKAPDRRNAKTKVIVKSGQTAVIGGIFETQANNDVSGVPGLRDIPILGALFRGKTDRNSKNELVIFVTPRILPPIQGDKKVSSFE